MTLALQYPGVFGFWCIEPEPMLGGGHGQAEAIGGWPAELGPERGDALDLIPDPSWSGLCHGVLPTPWGDARSRCTELA